VTAPGGSRGAPARTPGVSSAVRGAVIVGLAVIVGIVGLQILDDNDSGSGAAADSTSDARDKKGFIVTPFYPGALSIFQTLLALSIQFAH